MEKSHHYQLTVKWTGNKGEGTTSYQSYERSHTIAVKGKPEINGSSDPNFRGDASCHNPEELLLSSLAACHMLWYLHLCAVQGVVIIEYLDAAEGIMEEERNGSGRFKEVILHPSVVVADAGMIEKATALHEEANKMCFIARSVNFPVRHQSEIKAGL